MICIKIFISFIFVFLLAGCVDKISTYDEINYDEYSSMIENSEDFILYLGSANCSHCMDFKPTLEKVIKKYQIDVKYVDISLLSSKEYAVLKNKTKLQGTPTVVFVEDGVVQTSPKIVGALSYDKAVKIFKESGYIK